MLDQDHKIIAFLTTIAATIGPGQQNFGIFNYNFVQLLDQEHNILDF